MPIDEALRTFVRLIEATAERPLGLIALLVFAGSTLAYLLMRDVSPRASGRLMWVVFASLIAVGVTVSQTQQRSPSLWQVPLPAGGAPPALSPPAFSGAGSGSRSVPGPGGPVTSPRAPATTTSQGSGTVRAPSTSVATAPERGGGGTGAAGGGALSATPGGSAAGIGGTGGPPSGGAQAPGGEALDVRVAEREPIQGAERQPDRGTWVASGTASRELTTADHRCPNPAAGVLTCDGNPTRTTYRLRLDASAAERLVRPELRCIDGPCGSSTVHYTRVSADGRSVEASFDVWATPTRWRLAAGRERLSP